MVAQRFREAHGGLSQQVGRRGWGFGLHIRQLAPRLQTKRALRPAIQESISQQLDRTGSISLQ